MHESKEDLFHLQEVLDQSAASGGEHLLSIYTADRRLDAQALCERLAGPVLLAVATSDRSGRPYVGPVDGIFFRGAFCFSTAPDALRAQHLRQRPAVSATFAPKPLFAATVHGDARLIDLRSDEHRPCLVAFDAVYAPLYGQGFDEFLLSGPVCYRIEPRRMFGFEMTLPSTDA